MLAELWRCSLGRRGNIGGLPGGCWHAHLLDGLGLHMSLLRAGCLQTQTSCFGITPDGQELRDQTARLWLIRDARCRGTRLQRRSADRSLMQKLPADTKTFDD